MSVLQWNLPTVVPPDLLDPLLRKVLRLRPDLSLERTRLAVESLVVKGLSHHEMSAFSPAVTAAAAVLLTIRPELFLLLPPLFSPSPTSSSAFRLLLYAFIDFRVSSSWTVNGTCIPCRSSSAQH